MNIKDARRKVGTKNQLLIYKIILCDYRKRHTNLGVAWINYEKAYDMVPHNNGSIVVKMDGSLLEEKSSFRMLGLNFSSRLDWGSYIISIAKIIIFNLFYGVSFS